MPLPTFIVAGERRCGTTSLFRYLDAHPDVYIHPVADLAYFVDDGVTGSGTPQAKEGEIDEGEWATTHSLEEYEALFEEGRGRRAIGQKSADYLFWRPAHARIAEFVPEAKLIVSLRDPVERAWSHYWNEVGKGRETLSFEAALEAEEERIRRSAYARHHLSYVRRGFYDESLEALFSHVPRSRILVLTTEENGSRPAETLRRLFTFVGVDPDRGMELAGTRHNPNFTTVPSGWAQHPLLGWVDRGLVRVTRKLTRTLFAGDSRRIRAYNRRIESVFRRPASDLVMEEGTRQRLRDRFRPHVRALEELLDRDFPEWGL